VYTEDVSMSMEKFSRKLQKIKKKLKLKPHSNNIHSNNFFNLIVIVDVKKSHRFY